MISLLRHWFTQQLLRLTDPELFQHYQFYMNSEWWSEKELKRWQTKQIKQLIAYAYKSHPFYTKLYDKAKVKPSDFKKLEDLQKFPTIQVSDLKKALAEDTFSFEPNEVTMVSTTGSTGTPFVFPVDDHATRQRSASLYRTMHWYKLLFGTPNARFWRTTSSDSFSKFLKERVIGNRINLSIYNDDDPKHSLLDNKKIAAYLRIIKEKRIEVIDGYVSAMYLIAKYILKKKIRLSVTSVVTGAETLSSEEREVIEAAFQCPVYNRYGGSENSLVAHECGEHPDHALHVMDDKLLVEILKNNKPVKPGTVGEVTVTDFTNYAMPMIRLRLGDMASLAKSQLCPCGRHLTLISDVHGRINDVFTLPNGKKLISHVWHKVFREYPEIDQFQIVQHKVNLVKVTIVAPKISSDKLKELKKRVAEYLPGCTVQWFIVKTIKPGKGGKHRHSMSLVSKEL